MLVSWLVAIVTVLNNSIHEWAKHFIALFITSDQSDGHNEGMTRVVYTSLDALIKGTAIRSDTITKLSIHSRCQVLGHHIVVLGQVRVVAASRKLHVSIRRPAASLLLVTVGPCGSK